MNTLPLTIIDTRQETQGVDNYKNVSVACTNDHVVSISVMVEPFYWHYHPNSDETFLVMEGTIEIELEDRTVKLLPGQLFTVPAHTKHRTRPIGDRSVNVTFERADITTIRC